MQPILETRNLCKYYGKDENEVRAVDHTKITVEKGEFVAIVGKSGSGKSTLSRLPDVRPGHHRRQRHFQPERGRIISIPPAEYRLYFPGLQLSNVNQCMGKYRAPHRT